MCFDDGIEFGYYFLNFVFYVYFVNLLSRYMDLVMYRLFLVVIEGIVVGYN